MLTKPIPLGPFVLTEHIASGGMGEVWGGVHAPSGREIACKVITARYALDPVYVEEFTGEVGAVAALDHPGIVRVHDCGVLEADTAQASEGHLVEGSPYLVMERGQGTLKGMDEPLDWPDLEQTLLRLLDALAHAHARGIIHRDLKPANVLRMPTATPNDIRLTDFGIAHARDSRDTTSGMTEDSSGTPQYMAPEQLRGLWRDYGPWTDLYAVGCMTWYLVCGAPPWRGDLFSLITAHIGAKPPAFSPQIDVPEGLENWVLQLLEKEPQARFTCAADAAYALAQVGVARSRSLPHVRQGRPTPSALHTLTFRFDDSAADTVLDVPKSLGDALFAPPAAVEEAKNPAPPIPATWCRTRPQAPPAPLSGAGLGLFALRDRPLVGREEIQDVLWAVLREVHTSRTARFVLLRGGAGSGKTALLDWLCRRAMEVGAAEVWTARHREDARYQDGIRYALGRALGARGLHGAKLERRLKRVLGDTRLAPEDREAVAGFLAPAQTARIDDLDASRVCTRTLSACAARRPIVVRLDDAVHGPASLRWVHYVLSNRPQTPALFVACGRPGDLTSEAVRSVLGDLSQMAASSTLEVGPLNAAAHADLVRSMLHLDGTLADEIAARTEGNPMFAVQLVGDLVGRGVLLQRDGRFCLAAGRLDLPDDVHALWQQRMGRTLARRPRADRRAIELAATLGRRVQTETWLQLCAHAGVAPSPHLVSGLCNARVANRTDDGWEFAHALLHESALRTMREHGRAGPSHKLCAEYLLATTPAPNPLIIPHCLLAGDFTEAGRTLAASVRERLAQADYHGARQILERTVETLERLEASSDRDRSTAIVEALLAAVCAARRDFDTATALLEQSRGRLRDTSCAEDLGWAVERAAGLALAAGHSRFALQAYALAEALWTEAGRSEKAQRVATALRALGTDG